MKAAVTIALLVVLIPLSFALTGIGYGIVQGDRGELDSLGWSIAVHFWGMGFVAIMYLRHWRRDPRRS